MASAENSSIFSINVLITDIILVLRDTKLNKPVRLKRLRVLGCPFCCDHWNHLLHFRWKIFVYHSFILYKNKILFDIWLWSCTRISVMETKIFLCFCQNYQRSQTVTSAIVWWIFLENENWWYELHLGINWLWITFDYFSYEQNSIAIRSKYSGLPSFGDTPGNANFYFIKYMGSDSQMFGKSSTLEIISFYKLKYRQKTIAKITTLE